MAVFGSDNIEMSPTPKGASKRGANPDSLAKTHFNIIEPTSIEIMYGTSTITRIRTLVEVSRSNQSASAKPTKNVNTSADIAKTAVTIRLFKTSGDEITAR